MSGKGLSDLDLKPESTPPDLSFDSLPDYGGFTPPPQPGPYRFRLPANLERVWDTIDTALRATPDDNGQRLKMILEQDTSLLIVSSPGGKADNDLFRVTLNNAERNRGGGIVASDIDYLLRAFGEKKRPAGWIHPYIELLRKHSGQEFGADVRYSYSCNPNRNIRVYNAEHALEEVEQVGCGWRYYSGEGKVNAEKKIGYMGKVEGVYPLEVQCSCGAIVRAFGNLENIRA